MTQSNDENRDPLPLVAPCRIVRASDPVDWLRRGWRDLRRAPRVSLFLGLLVAIVSWAISAAAWYVGSWVLLAAMLSSFILVAPLMAMGFYSISARLERGERPTLKRVWRNARVSVPNVAVFGLILMVVGLVWARAATMVHVFFPVDGDIAWTELAIFLAIGSAVGAIFCAIVFIASAFSLPMIKDREVDMVTAVLSSANAVLRNKPAMLVWALLIVAGVAVSFMTALLGLVVVIPWLGHGTWHAYRATLDVSRWPARHIV